MKWDVEGIEVMKGDKSWAQDFLFWKERGRNTPGEVWAFLEPNTKHFQGQLFLLSNFYNYLLLHIYESMHLQPLIHECDNSTLHKSKFIK